MNCTCLCIQLWILPVSHAVSLSLMKYNVLYSWDYTSELNKCDTTHPPTAFLGKELEEDCLCLKESGNSLGSLTFMGLSVQLSSFFFLFKQTKNIFELLWFFVWVMNITSVTLVRLTRIIPTWTLTKRKFGLQLIILISETREYICTNYTLDHRSNLQNLPGYCMMMRLYHQKTQLTWNRSWKSGFWFLRTVQ